MVHQEFKPDELQVAKMKRVFKIVASELCKKGILYNDVDNSFSFINQSMNTYKFSFMDSLIRIYRHKSAIKLYQDSQQSVGKILPIAWEDQKRVVNEFELKLLNEAISKNADVTSYSINYVDKLIK